MRLRPLDQRAAVGFVGGSELIWVEKIKDGPLWRGVI